MLRATKVRIYPTPEQAEYLDWPPESPDNQYHLNK
ncbi:helix-turn-helix domain-containing protein [Escherichia coli]